MSLAQRYRDQPVELVNRSPRIPAYACIKDEDYLIARDAFHSRFLSLTSEVGPWAGDTLTNLYNCLIASIKLCNYEEAEEQCRYILGLLGTLGMSEELYFVCLECILATSYFLSGKLQDAEHLFTSIHKRGISSQTPVHDQFDVLSLVRLTTKDCLVFWESSPKLSVLLPVADYVDQLEGRRRKKSLLRSGLGSLRRIASIKTTGSSASRNSLAIDGARFRTYQIQEALHKATSMFDFGFEKRYTRSKLSMSEIPAERAASALATIEDVVDSEVRSKKVGSEDVVEKAHTIKDWLEEQKSQPPIPDEPLDDTAIGFTYRSIETTTSSMHGQKPQNLLDIVAWAADGDHKCRKALTALLDDGAPKNCISEDFADAIRAAPVQRETDVWITTAIGQRVDVLGKVKVGFSWAGPSGTQFTKIKCYVVKDLQVGMLICANVILKLGLRDSPSLLAPVLYSARSKQTKHDDAQKSQEIAELAKAAERQEAEKRKAERARLEQIAALPLNQNRKPRATMTSRLGSFDSMLGGSDTSASSPRSSLTGYDRSTTTTPSDESTRVGTSMESKRPDFVFGSPRHRRSKAVDSFELPRK